jgi:hypothetical protein
MVVALKTLLPGPAPVIGGFVMPGLRVRFYAGSAAI